MNTLLDLPMWLVGIIVIGGCAIIGALTVAVVRPFVGRRHSDEHNSVIGLGFGAAATLYAIIAGLLVFGVFSSFGAASVSVADESANLTTMYHNAHEFPQPQRDQAQNAIRAYATSVLNDEWPKLADGKSSDKTESALNNMFTVFGPMEPATNWADQYSVAYGQLNDVVHLRNARIDSSQSALPLIYWFLLVAGGMLIVVYLAVSYTENRQMHAISVALMAAMLGVMFFLLLEVSQPFRGSISVSKDPFEQALVTMDHIG